MLNIKVNPGDKDKIAGGNPNEYPTRFSRFVVKENRRLNELTAPQKVVAAITECLAMQGREDRKNYYVDGDKLVIDHLSTTTSGELKDGRPIRSYTASGSFKIGKIDGEILRRGSMTFNISFKDSEDDMGLDSLEIISAEMNESPHSR